MTARIDFGTVHRPDPNGGPVEQVLYVLALLVFEAEDEAGQYHSPAMEKLDLLAKAAWDIEGER